MVTHILLIVENEEINILFCTLGPFWNEEILRLVPVQHSLSPCPWRWSTLDGEYQGGHRYNPEEGSDVQLLHVHPWRALLAEVKVTTAQVLFLCEKEVFGHGYIVVFLY